MATICRCGRFVALWLSSRMFALMTFWLLPRFNGDMIASVIWICSRHSRKRSRICQYGVIKAFIGQIRFASRGPSRLSPAPARAFSTPSVRHSRAECSEACYLARCASWPLHAHRRRSSGNNSASITNTLPPCAECYSVGSPPFCEGSGCNAASCEANSISCCLSRSACACSFACITKS